VFTNIQKRKIIILIFVVVAISSIMYNTTSPSFAQVNNTQGNGTDYVKFHSNIEQIIGHIEKAEDNKNNNNDTLAYSHTSHPIEEVISLITIPLSSADKKLNDTYFDELYTLSNLVSPSAASNNITKDEFSKNAQSSIDLSNKVIATVVPATTLNNTDHNITVIQNLLTTSEEEYSEGVKGGKIILLLEYQDGSAFMDRAHEIFNNTKSIVENRETISSLFNNLTNSVQQQKNSSEINKIVEEINHELSESSSSQNTTTETKANNEKSAQDYISNIRSLLDQVISSYSSNDTVKTKELATAAYLDNFEHLEKPIGKELADKGEDLMRVQLRDQIDNKTSLDKVKQTINEIDQLLAKAESLLKS
jgi:hypothetical protein